MPTRPPSPQPKEVFDIHKTLPPKQKLKTYQAAGQRSPNAPVPQASGRGFSLKRLIITAILLIFLFFITIAVWDGIELSRASKKMFGSGNLLSLLGGDLQSQNGRTNILLAGYSADDPGHSGAQLTDSIMLISLSKKGSYILSIPRDLYVLYGTNGCIYGDEGKINAVYECGQSQNFSEAGYASGGMGLLEKVISNDLNLPINYYALLDYAAFRDTVNAVGGITINIQSNDPRGIYDPSLDYQSATCCALAKYPNGPVSLNGQQALDLARARGDSYGSYGFAQADFDRTQHQRQMLVALKQKAVNWRTIIDPRRSGHLFDGMANNVQTDLNTGNVLPLFSLAKNIQDFQSVSLRDLNGKNYLSSYGGALIPSAGWRNFTDIQAALDPLNN